MNELVRLERGALDRWITGDPGGFLSLYAQDVSYFDPFTDIRVDGRDALKRLYAQIAGKFSIDRYEMLNPSVASNADLAHLTYNLVNYVLGADGEEQVLNRWNATEIYRREDDGWRIIHSHWSFTKPDLSGIAPDVA